MLNVSCYAQCMGVCSVRALRSRLWHPILILVALLVNFGCSSVGPLSITADGHLIQGPILILDEDFPLDRDINRLQDVRDFVFDTNIAMDRRPFLERETLSLTWYGHDATRLEHAHFLPAPIYLLDQHIRLLVPEPGGVLIERFDIIDVHPVATQEAREGLTARYGILGSLVNSVFGRFHALFRMSDEETGESDQAEDYYVCDVRLRYRGEVVSLRKTRHFMAPGQTRDVFLDEQARYQLRALVQICIAETVTELVHQTRRMSRTVTAVTAVRE